MEKETPEEAAEKYEEIRVAYDENYIDSNDIQDLKESYYYKGRRDECIKWQGERMYSEEEVIAIVEKSRETGLTAEYLLLTEQFKKK